MFMAGRPQQAASLAGALLIITPGRFFYRRYKMIEKELERIIISVEKTKFGIDRFSPHDKWCFMNGAFFVISQLENGRKLLIKRGHEGFLLNQ